MFCSHFLFELAAIKCLSDAAFFAFNQRRADGLDIGLARLVTANQITYVFAVIGEFARCDLCLDPTVLLVGHGDGFAGEFPNDSTSTAKPPPCPLWLSV